MKKGYIKRWRMLVSLWNGGIMRRQEYETNLDEIEKIIDSSGEVTVEIKDILEKLYSYKPVSLRWHILKCRIMNREKRFEEASEIYGEMICKESKAINNINLWHEYINSLNLCGKVDEAIQEKYMQSKLLGDSVYTEFEEKLRKKKEQFIAGNEYVEILQQLEDMMYVCCQRWLALFIYLYKVSLYPETEDIKKLNKYLSFENVAYLYECMQKKVVAIIVSEKDNADSYDILSYLLNKLNIKVYFIGEPVCVDGDYSFKDSVVVSMDNSNVCEDCVYIPPVMKKEDGDLTDTNIPHIIDYICRNKTEDDFAFTFASNTMIEKLRKHTYISKRFERLSRYDANYLENEIGFAWCGDYYTYISNLYKCDARELVERQPECMFSIVVPVRNATETLYYTLKTCIEQEYTGAYEVVLSDNSEEGNDVAFETYKKLNSDLIKYYRTPRQLNLTKSYEYAYLQTRGKYIISIGADDAVLPWALDILENVWEMDKNRDRDIIRWDRGFYAWPGFNGGQENELIIPYHYKKKEVTARINTGKQYLEELKQNPGIMYMLPNMYINSGFRRKYMDVLYENTGRLWDGYAQDIYTGVQNVALNDDILYIVYPITIAGMSSTSVGALCTKNSNDSSINCKKKIESVYGGRGICAIIKSKHVSTVTEFGSDVSAIYVCIYHLMTKGILPYDYISGDDEKDMFINCYNSLSLHSDKYEKYMNMGQYLSSIRGDEMSAWFEDNMAVNLKADLKFFSKELYEQLNEKKKYSEGYNEDGGVTIDASRYNVSNIYEAVQLFKQFIHF